MALQRHLVSVWNPAYGADVMESHIRILHDQAQSYRLGNTDEDEVFVWWGRIRSTRRQGPLPHLDQIIAIQKDLVGDGEEVTAEVQLYLTDYRSLYVAHVGEITTDDPRNTDDDGHIPEMYKQEGRACDCWFRLWDIRRLVSDDTSVVVQELAKLRNTAYENMPVSIYGGMVNLPLIVTRPDGARYFEPDARDHLTDNRYWVEFDSENAGLGETERELREHCFGEDIWFNLDPGTRTFIATAEKLFRDHRADPMLDFSPVIVSFAKAFEVQTNSILQNALSRVAPDARLINLDGRTIDVGSAGPYSLGELARIIGECKELNSALKKRIQREGEWFTASLPAILKSLALARNSAAHADVYDREYVRRTRNQYLGIGCEGDLVRLAKVKVDGFDLAK